MISNAGWKYGDTLGVIVGARAREEEEIVTWKLLFSWVS